MKAREVFEQRGLTDAAFAFDEDHGERPGARLHKRLPERVRMVWRSAYDISVAASAAPKKATKAKAKAKRKKAKRKKKKKKKKKK